MTHSAPHGGVSIPDGSAVALFVYRRPELARQALAAIRRHQPSRLYFIADGEREPSEAAACLQSQRLVEEVDWPCRVRSNFAQAHLGCARRIASGVSWVLEHEQSAIFLEEDCVADASFFPYCEELLARFEDQERVMMITGFNLLGSWRPAEASYSFSHLGSSWGWATWRRAWRYFDASLASWRTDQRTLEQLGKLLGDEEIFAERARLFDLVAASQLDSWAVPWNLACLRRSGCCAVPSVNLIENRGFGLDATHHRAADDPNAGVPSSRLGFPLRHPQEIVVDRDLDRRWHRRACGLD